MLSVNISKTLAEFKLDVAFSVDQEIMAILGPSGCGKTMTLKCIAGLMSPDTGAITIDGKVWFDSSRTIDVAARTRKVGYVFQNYALFPHMTVYDNIAFGMHKLSTEQRRERVQLLLQKMRLEQMGHRFPSQLSGGQQQRVALVRAIAPEPDVLLLDEPFSALDTNVKKRLETELLELHNYYKGHVLFVTHNLEEAYRLSSKIAIYEAGRILQYGEKRTIIERPCSPVVAHLTGVKNIFNGVLSRVDAASTYVKVIDLGAELRLQQKNLQQVRLNREIAVAIRPEYIELTQRQGENCVKVVLSEIIEELSSYTYCFQMPDAQANQPYIEAFMPKLNSNQLQVGEKYWLHFPPEKIFAIQ